VLTLREPDPGRSLRLYARNVARIHKRYADLHEVLQMAAAADDELAELWQALEDERRTGAGYIIDALLGKGPLKPGLDRDSAVDLLWVFNEPGIFRRLVRRRGWTSQRYKQWLADTFCDQLLAPAGR